MITIKLKLEKEINITDYQNQFSNLVRFCYNRFVDGITNPSDIERLCKSLNNMDLMDASWIKSARSKAHEIYLTKHEHICFGGKKNFQDYSNKKITKEEYDKRRLMPITMIGSASDSGNRKFKLDIINNNKIIFKPNRNTHIDLLLPRLSKNQKELLYKLEECCVNKETPVTISLTNTHVYIIFNESIISKQYDNYKVGRILSLDMNPNYIGIAICDYDGENEQKVIYKEIISNKLINDIDTTGLDSTHPKNKYKNNKREYETYQIVKHIINLCKSNHCQYIIHEKLDIKSKDNKHGKKYNKLVNNSWLRNKFINNLHKLCNINSIKYEEILPQYSSFIGCIKYENEIDSVAAALELNRRANLFIKMYRTKEMTPGDIVFPKLSKKLILNRWKDDGLTDKDFDNWKELYVWVKNAKISYRVLFDINIVSKSFSLLSSKSKIKYFSIK